MSLNRRQTRLYTFKADLYRPSVIAPYTSKTVVDAVADSSYGMAAAYALVPCYFQSAAEAAVPTPEGLLAEGNLFTFFNFYFDALQEIENTWAVHLRQPGHPNNLDWFYVQDNPKVTVSAGRRAANQSTVFTRRGNVPNLVKGTATVVSPQGTPTSQTVLVDNALSRLGP